MTIDILMKTNTKEQRLYNNSQATFLKKKSFSYMTTASSGEMYSTMKGGKTLQNQMVLSLKKNKKVLQSYTWWLLKIFL